MHKIMDNNSTNDDYGSNFCSINTSFLSPSNTSPTSTPLATALDDSVAAGSRIYRARLILENHLYDELLNRYRLAITRLSKLTSEANALQEENEWLRLANEELASHLDSLRKCPTTSVGGSSDHGNVGGAIGVGSNSPTSVINDNEERFTLPKSISIRSPGFFKLANSPSSTHLIESNQSPPLSQYDNGTRLRVRREEKAIEMNVYNQGTYKTELCNKWEETATCPYGEQCRFAHGLSELRPVVRHPRYKTQVCRMVLAGVTCPYGHRCHFRHSLHPNTRLS